MTRHLARHGVAWLAIVLAVSLAACQSGPSKVEAEPVEEQVTVEPDVVDTPIVVVDEALIDNLNTSQFGAAGPGVKRMALLLPLTGQHAELGKAMSDAATMALFDIANPNLELVVRDTQGTELGAQSAAREIVQARPDLVIGPLFATNVESVAMVARQAGVNMISLSSDRRAALNGVYLMGLDPFQQVDRVVGYAAEQGYMRFAALVPAGTVGSQMVQAFREAAEAHGVEVVGVSFFDPNSQDLGEVVRNFTSYDGRRAALQNQIAELEAQNDEVSRAAIERLQTMELAGTLNFDALFVPDSGAELRSLAGYLSFYGVDPGLVKILGLSSWEDPTLLSEPGLAGAWFATTPPERREWFFQRYEETYGEAAPRLATLTYDAVALAAALMQRGDFSDAALTDWRGFGGVEGLFRFAPNGIPERGLAVMEIERGGFRIVSPAATAFDGPQVSTSETYEETYEGF